MTPNIADLSKVAHNAAHGIWLRTRRMADHDDLRSESQLALLQILVKFDPARTDNLPQHVYSKTRMMLLDYLRTQKPGGRHKKIDLVAVNPWTLPDGALDPERRLLAEESSAAGRIDALLRRCALTAREQAVIDGLRRGERLADIGARLGVKQSRVSQLKMSATTKMRAAVHSA